MRFRRLTIITFLLCPILALANTDIQLRKLSDGVWMHTSFYTYPNGVIFPSNGLVVRTGKELLLIDTAWGDTNTAKLLEKIATEIQLPVTAAVVTHSHGDRAGGIEVLQAKKIPVYSHPLTQQRLIESGFPVADHIFGTLAKPGTSVSFQQMEVFFPGAAHAPDNIMIWLPKQRMLFGGCALRAQAADTIGNTAHADMHSWGQVLRDIAQRYGTVTMVIPGHGEPGGADLISHTQALVAKSQQ